MRRSSAFLLALPLALPLALLLALLDPAGVGRALAFGAGMPAGHPPLGATRGAPSASPPTSSAAAARGPLVDLNSASLTELKTLPGIGDAEARRIVGARPYPSKAKLLADDVLPAATFDAIRHRVVAVQKTTPGRPR